MLHSQDHILYFNGKVRTLCLVLTTSKVSLKVTTLVQVKVRIGLRVRFRNSVMMVKVRAWGTHYVSESPHKDVQTCFLGCLT